LFIASQITTDPVMKALLTTFCFFALALMTLRAQSVENIIEKHLEALGGKERLRDLKSAQISATVSVAGFEVKAVTTVLQNTGIRIEQEVQGMKLIQAY